MLQALLGHLDPVGQKGLVARQVLVVQVGPQDRVDLQDLLEQQVVLDPVDHQALQVQAGHQVHLVLQEVQEQLDHLGQVDLRVLQVVQALRDPVVLQVLQVLRVPQVLQVHQDLRDLRERQEALDRLDLPAPLVLREALDQVVQVGQLEAQGEQGHQVRLGQLEQ